MNLRQAAQRALKAMEDGEWRADMVEFSDALIALRAALAEPEPYRCHWVEKGQGHCERNKRMGWKDTEPEQNPFGDDAERYARKLHEEREYYKALFTEHKPQTTHWEGCEAVHPECRATPRKPLTDEEIVDIWAGVSMDYDDEINIIELARALERAHGITGEQT